MTATLADQSKHARSLSTFAAFEAHFLSAFAASIGDSQMRAMWISMLGR